MPNIGWDEIGDDTTSVRNILEEKEGAKDKKHYFYLLQMPSCGGYRLKLGKTANIYARFKYYQDHLYDDEIIVHRLRSFNNTDVGRYTGKGMKLYALFEREAKYALRDFNDEKTKSGVGLLTEWFSPDTEDDLLATFDIFVTDFQNSSFEKIKKRRSARTKTNYNISDDEEDEDSDT